MNALTLATPPRTRKGSFRSCVDFTHVAVPSFKPTLNTNFISTQDLSSFISMPGSIYMGIYFKSQQSGRQKGPECELEIKKSIGSESTSMNWWFPLLMYYPWMIESSCCFPFALSIEAFGKLMNQTRPGSQAKELLNWRFQYHLPHLSSIKGLNSFQFSFSHFTHMDSPRSTLVSWLYQINQSCFSLGYSANTFCVALSYLDRYMAQESFDCSTIYGSSSSLTPYMTALVCLMLAAKYMEDFNAPSISTLVRILQWYLPAATTLYLHQTIRTMERHILSQLQYQLNCLTPSMALYEMVMTIPPAFPGFWMPQDSSMIPPLFNPTDCICYSPQGKLVQCNTMHVNQDGLNGKPFIKSSFETDPIPTLNGSRRMTSNLPSPPSTPLSLLLSPLKSFSTSGFPSPTWVPSWQDTGVYLDPTTICNRFLPWLPILDSLQLQIMALSTAGTCLAPTILGGAMYCYIFQTQKSQVIHPMKWIFQQASEWEACQLALTQAVAGSKDSSALPT